MKTIALRIGTVVALSAATSAAFSQTTLTSNPYRVLKTTQTMGTGGIDYVHADNENRRLYVPRGNQVLVFDLDSLKSAGAIPNARAHGVAVDPKAQHGFCSSSPVVMWDAKTLETIKTIDVQGRPDGIEFEPMTERIYVFSHSQPNATVIEGKDGSVVGTIDLGGAPEQAASDGQGHLYVDLEDKDNIAVVDVKALKVTNALRLGRQGRRSGRAGFGCEKPHPVRDVPRPPNMRRSGRGRWEDPCHAANRPRNRRGRVQPQHYGSVQFARRWHADHHKGNQPDQLRGGTDASNQAARQDLHAGRQEQSDYLDHDGARSRLCLRNDSSGQWRTTWWTPKGRRSGHA